MNSIINFMKTYKGILGKTKGLMFSRKRNVMFVFNKERKISLHTWFVFFPIDIILLDENMDVIEVKEDLKPFRFWKSEKKAKYVIEIGDKEIKEKDLQKLKI